MLRQMLCVPCRGDVPPATAEERAVWMLELPDWRVVTVDGIDRLERVYRFKNFAEALAFTDKVGEIAEAAGHHPAILTEWGRVTVTWWTHALKGLHRNDFIMAAQTDAIERPGGR